MGSASGASRIRSAPGVEQPGDPTRDKGEKDPRELRVHRNVPQRDVPYVPTDEPVVAAMLRFAAVTENDVVYDLGCGDGRIVIAAAKRFGCRAIGVDIDPLRIQESRDNARRANVGDRVRFHCQSFFDTDFSDASVVFLYLLPAINCKLRPRLLNDLKPGTRIVANYFGMSDWQPDMRAEAHHRVLHQWIVPAQVAGSWRCVIDTPGRRTHMRLDLRRHYQNVTGVARLNGQTFPIVNGKLFADQLTFRLVDPEKRRPIKRFEGRVEGNVMRGSAQLGGPDGPLLPWGALRVTHT
jgi:precorrin-6B methylase 2